MRILRNTLWTTVGLFGLAALIAMPAAADQVILDDLIVDGSICAGFDCVNGESFGFDTIRIKENNLRIRAVDTSTSASFPTRDWQITFNDSSNGGAEKFSIDDIDGGRTPFTIEANSPSHSLYVDDGGRLGFGTNTPVADLHVKTGNTPTLRLEQDGSSGFSPQTWDVAGNEANFFIRDATNGSTLPFRIRPGAPSSAIDIQGSGDVVFGGASAGGATTTTIQNTTTGGNADIHVASASDQDAVIGLGVSPSFTAGNADAFIFGYNGNAGVGEAFIGTRPSSGDGDITIYIENSPQMKVTSQGIESTSTCIEMGSFACTASGAGFSCVSGDC